MNKDILDFIIIVDKKIVEDFKFDDCVEVFVSRDVFIILKDYKFDFINNLICRFINFIKLEIGIISKYILDNINKEIIKVIKVNLWRSILNVIEWF